MPLGVGGAPGGRVAAGGFDRPAPRPPGGGRGRRRVTSCAAPVTTTGEPGQVGRLDSLTILLYRKWCKIRAGLPRCVQKLCVGDAT